MTTLRQALQLKPVHFITIIGRENGLGIDSNLRKPDLIDKVALALSNPAGLPARLSRLTAAEEQALTDVLAAGGRLPARYLTPAYGPLRSPRNIIKTYREYATLRQVQDAALSPLERLGLLGLVFHDSQTNDLFVPDDLIPHLPRPELPPPAAAAPALGSGPAPIDLLCHDLTCLLALLQRDEVSPLHGRWLPPHFLATWADHFAVPPDHPQARSELKTGRRRFLHYLAESAGLVSGQATDDGRPPTAKTPRTTQYAICPTPAAWLWLNSPRQERLQTLWQAWTSPELERWRRFRLPGADWQADPARLLEPVHQALLKIDPTDPTLFADMLLKSQPHLLDLTPGNLLNRREVLRDTVVELLVGPLVWLGALSISNEQLTINNSSFSILNSSFTDDAPPPAKFSITSDIQLDPLQSTLTLTLNGGLPEPRDLMVAIELGVSSSEFQVEKINSPNSLNSLNSPAPPLPRPLAYSVLLTPYSFISALHRGWSPHALLDALNRLAQRPLTGQETDLLRAWADLAGRMTISPAVLLETTDPDIITRLASTRRGRSLIHRTLSSRTIVVDPPKLPQLIRRLTEQEGVPPKAEGGERKDEQIPPSSFILHPSNIPHLWLMLKVYQSLGQYIRLPVRMPQAVVDRLAAMLSPGDMAGAEVAAEQTLAALQLALDGQMPFPPWPEDGLPVEHSLAVIEQAMATGQNVQLLYYAASTDRLTRRVVEPYRVQWHGGAEEQGSRGAGEQGRLGDEEIEPMEDNLKSPQSGTPYLIGFCHHVQAERMFRLDRIREIEAVSAEEGAQLTGGGEGPGEYGGDY